MSPSGMARLRSANIAAIKTLTTRGGEDDHRETHTQHYVFTGVSAVKPPARPQRPPGRAVQLAAANQSAVQLPARDSDRNEPFTECKITRVISPVTYHLANRAAGRRGNCRWPGG